MHIIFVDAMDGENGFDKNEGKCKSKRQAHLVH